MSATASRLDIALVYPTHDYRGGAERYLNQLATHLAQEGHGVTIVCRRHQQPPHPGVRFVRLPLRSLGNAWRTWAFARAAERHVRAAHYDLVVGLGRTWCQDVVRCGGCHQTWLGIERRLLLRPWQRALGKGRLKGWVALRIERRAYRSGRYRRVLVNSRLVGRDLMRRHGVPEARTAVVPNGVDPERFHPRHRVGPGAALRASCGIGPEAPALLFLGAGWARKGLGPLLEAMPGLLRRRPDARLLVVGRDKQAGRYARRAAALGLEGRVHFLGWRGDPEVCFAAADLYVLPTLYDSFAYTVLEACAAGVPVVTTDHAGAAELLEPGVHGEVLPVDSGPDVLAEALVTWTERERLRAAAKEVRALAENHTIAHCMERTERVLLEAARETRAPAASQPALPGAPS